MKKVLAAIIIILILVGGVYGGYMYLQNKHSKEIAALTELYNDSESRASTLEIQNESLKNPPKIALTVSTIKEYTAAASELITYKYYYTDAGTYEKSKTFFSSDVKIPFTTDEVVYVYSGTISAGVDVNEIKYVVDDVNMKIYIAMPEAKIIAHELDEESFKTYDVKNSIFTSSSLDEYADFQSVLKTTQEEKIMGNDEFWGSVKNNAEAVIRDLITAHDEVTDYTLEFSWVEE